MGDYAGYARDFLGIVFYLYIGICAIALMLALWLPKGKESKMAAAILVIVLASILPIKAFLVYREEKQAADAFKLRYDKAKALFDERCKSAGEKIYKTVENVDGVLLLNIRNTDIENYTSELANPMWSDAALPKENMGHDYIRTFLYWEHNPQAMPRGFLNATTAKAVSRGYQYVDTKQADGSVMRHRLDQTRRTDDNKLSSEPVIGLTARYALGFKNEINAEDRKYWVAGTTIIITDTYTGEIIAERRSYSFEPGLGNTDGSRLPWAFAVTCPSMVRERAHYIGNTTRYFADQIIKPIQGK